ncbi:MAG: hypothetical protein PHI18_06465 [bacterium]|nr:hypothetical protein [bacterium]
MSNANFLDPSGRPALRAAGQLRDRLRKLMALSLQQADAVQRADHDALGVLLDRKDELIGELRDSVEEMRNRGWKLRQADTFTGGIACMRILGEAADLSRRLQAHERHVIAQLASACEHVETRLQSVGRKRRAAMGYRVNRAAGKRLDAVR